MPLALAIRKATAGDWPLGTISQLMVRMAKVEFQYHTNPLWDKLSADGKPISHTVWPAGTVNRVLLPTESENRRESKMGAVASNSTMNGHTVSPEALLFTANFSPAC